MILFGLFGIGLPFGLARLNHPVINSIEPGLRFSEDVRLDKDENIYVGMWFSGRIAKYDRHGNFLRSWPTPFISFHFALKNNFIEVHEASRAKVTYVYQLNGDLKKIQQFGGKYFKGNDKHKILSSKGTTVFQIIPVLTADYVSVVGRIDYTPKGRIRDYQIIVSPPWYAYLWPSVGLLMILVMFGSFFVWISRPWRQ